MLARRLTLRLDGISVGTTPMLVPSISSRINIDIAKIIEVVSETITGPSLISAYDIHYIRDLPSLSKSTLTFIDSGGYECAKEHEVSEIGLYRPESHEWNRELHLETIRKLDTAPTKVIISYDHPRERTPLDTQIKDARALFKERNDVLKEFLIKPELNGSNRIDIRHVIQNLDSLSPFDIIGFTEKELGPSVFDRMIAIARIRNEMDENRLNIPIHIFGSLDPITTPLYYLSGADIFDGLAWLRFIFARDTTLYIDSSGPSIEGIHVNMDQIWAMSIAKNYNFIRRLSMDFEKYQSTGDYQCLGPNHEFYRKSYEDLLVNIGGEIDGK